MVDRLGWTLLHFLWEGAALAVAFALTLSLTKRESVRYGLALGTLALLAASPVATFMLLGAPASAIAPGIARDTPGETIVGAATPTSLLGMTPLVALWAVGVVLLGLRLVGTLLHLERWRRRHARPAAPEDQARFDALARRLGLRRRIVLFLSDRIEVPSAWGVLRPVVVLPASLVSGLPPAQVEGILLHELAHVRRHDYLVNLLQGVVETALFYHPAVWWVSSVVRRERERLCDDVAVVALGDPMPYARALLRLEERRQAPRPALSAKEGDLMNRIARVLAPHPASARLSPLAPSLAALAVVGLALGGILRAEAQAKIKPGTLSAAKRPDATQTWHRTGLDVTVHPVGDALRVMAKTKDSIAVGYYRLGDRDFVRNQPDIEMAIHASSSDHAFVRIDVRAGASHVVANYRLGGPTKAKPPTLRILPLVDVQTQTFRSQAELSAARARLADAEAIRLNEVAGRIVADPPKQPEVIAAKAQIAVARKRVEEAQRAVERSRSNDRPGAGYGKLGKIQHPTWNASDYPHGVAHLAAPESSDARAFAQAQQELSKAIPTQKPARPIDPNSLEITDARYNASSRTYLPLNSNPVPKTRTLTVSGLETRRIDVQVQPPAKANIDTAKERANARFKVLQEVDAMTEAKAQKTLDAARVTNLERVLTLQREALGRANAQSLRSLADAQGKGLFGKVNPPIWQWKDGKPLDKTSSRNPGYGSLIVNGDLLLHRGGDLGALRLFDDSKVEIAGGKVSIDAKDAAFATLVRALARKAHLSVVIGKGVYADVSLVLTERSPADALAVLCRAASAEVRTEGGVSYVSPRITRDR